MRDRFIDTTTALLGEDPRTALVLADISADAVRAGRRTGTRTGCSTSASGNN